MLDLLGNFQWIIGGAGVAIVGMVLTYFRGKKAAHKEREAQDNEDYRTTTKALDDAFRDLDDGGNGDHDKWLRDRSKRKP